MQCHMTNDVAVIVGTRPEIIKCAPVIAKLREMNGLRPVVLSTGQHEEMAEQAFRAFNLKPDINLGLMTVDQTPLALLGSLLPKLELALRSINPRGVVVQGDTTTALGGALAAYHLALPCAHIEAGLRTFEKYAPFPEEMNRSLISVLGDLHFAPTAQAAENLRQAGITAGVHVTGNTVVDALLEVRGRMERGELSADPAVTKILNQEKKLILVTGHRRENFDAPLESLCRVLRDVVSLRPEVAVVYPVHLNPRVRETVLRELQHTSGVHLLPPVDYPSLVELIAKSTLIVTDSGGIQEEAPSFGVPVIVTRATTERNEAILTGAAQLIPLSEPERLKHQIVSWLDRADAARSESPKAITNPFGDGRAAERIATLLNDSWLRHSA